MYVFLQTMTEVVDLQVGRDILREMLREGAHGLALVKGTGAPDPGVAREIQNVRLEQRGQRRRLTRHAVVHLPHPGGREGSLTNTGMSPLPALNT